MAQHRGLPNFETTPRMALTQQALADAIARSALAGQGGHGSLRGLGPFKGHARARILPARGKVAHKTVRGTFFIRQRIKNWFAAVNPRPGAEREKKRQDFPLTQAHV